MKKTVALVLCIISLALLAGCENNSAASSTIISIRSGIGMEFLIKAFPAAPMRFDVMIDGMTPVATVRMYFPYLSFVPLP